MHDDFTTSAPSAQAAPASFGGMPLALLRGGFTSNEFAVIIAVYALARGGAFVCPTGAEIAAISGLQRTHINRAIRSLRERDDLGGIFEIDGRRFDLLQMVEPATKVSNETNLVSAMQSESATKVHFETKLVSTEIENETKLVSASQSESCDKGLERDQFGLESEGLTGVVPSLSILGTNGDESGDLSISTVLFANAHNTGVH